MKSLAFISFVFSTIVAQSQIDFEDYYSGQDLQAVLDHARTPAETVDAIGMLGTHYKGVHQDSLGDAYFKEMDEIAKRTSDVSLTARIMWWNMRYQDKVEKANQLLQFASEHHQVSNKIAAHLFLSEYYIHRDLSLAEKNVLSAKELLDAWKSDTTGKDSITLEFYGSASHTYIHKRDGVMVARYLLALQDHAEHNANPGLKYQAMNMLANMYFEWSGQQQKATPWFNQLYTYYNNTAQANKLLYICRRLSNHHSNRGETDSCILYLKEEEKLRDSLKAYGFHQYYCLWSKLSSNLITGRQFIETLDNDYDKHLFLHPGTKAQTKARFYVYRDQLDSAAIYLSIAEKLGEENEDEWMVYFLKRKNYDRAVSLIKRLIEKAKQRGDVGRLLFYYRRLSNTYNDKSDYVSAYNYLVLSDQYKDSLDQLDNKEQIASMEMQKQFEFQQATFAEQRRLQETEQEKTAFRNRIRFYGLFGGIAVLLLLAGILWRNNRRKQKDKLKIEEAYQELKSTQQQLIQSEKMASLGELTAGIAHEIQNPLNFVNNFSDVNSELIEELKSEKAKVRTERNEQLEDELLRDIAQNLEKISHHGKRADAIVKGMLQHSRSSSSVKEPTDINALCDEYLRLAYHGLKAKDKSFNATIKKDFDGTIGNLNLVPQDIGRVILNLINNAFYAVDEKKKSGDAGYEPAVSVSTKRVNGKPDSYHIEIRVADNGKGIPQKVLDKIFQPFFTTKPTGQGTGLGLSLSYDIIKAHGGEIKVNTGENKGAEFVITLPI